MAPGLAACSSGSSSGGASGNSTGAAGGQCSNIASGPIHIANIAPLSGPTASSGQLTGMAMVSGLKQINWSPKIVGWGGLNDYGVTAAQVPPGTVDGCVISYAQGEPTSKLLTPQRFPAD